MAITYSVTAINARLSGVVSAIDGGGGAGNLNIYAGGLLLAAVPLAVPSGVVAGGVLTFHVPRSAVAVGTGIATATTITNFAGVLMISGLTVGIPLSGANVIVSNGSNTLQFNAGQTVSLISGQIIGS